MWLVLSAPEDTGALHLAALLRERGLNPLVQVSTEDLGLADWVYHTGGEVETSEIGLPGGERILSGSLRGVLNRLYAVPATALARMEKADRDYAREELHALYTSWLHGLACPVINRAGATGLCGNWPDRSWWRARAFSAGLPTDAYSWRAGDEEPMDTVSMASAILLDGRVVEGDVPLPLHPACARFAGFSDPRLLGLRFSVNSGSGWLLIDANPLPDLSQSGHALAEALARALQQS